MTVLVMFLFLNFLCCQQIYFNYKNYFALIFFQDCWDFSCNIKISTFSITLVENINNKNISSW